MTEDAKYFLSLLVKMPDREVFKGWYTTAKVRRDIMTGDEQNRIIRKGKVVEIQWENLGGGVYRIFLL